MNNENLFDDQDPTTPITKLKELFSDGKLPTGNDFAAIFDSYFHKDIKIPEADIDGLIDDLNSKEDKTDADKRFNDLNTAVKDLKNSKEDKTDAEAKFKDLDNRKEDKADADKRFGDLNTAVDDLENNKEDKTEAEAKSKDLDDKKEDKTDADKRFGDLNTAVEDLKKNKEDKTEADQKFGDLNTAVKNLQDSKEDKADMVNYLQISPDGLQDNDIAIREGGKWIRKQASEVSTIKALTLDQNGQTIGTFDGKAEETINIDAPQTDGTDAKGEWNIDITGKADISKLHYLNNTNKNFISNRKNVVSSSNAPISGADFHFTGIIKVVLPDGWTNSMLSLDIALYNYYLQNTGYSKISLGGYNFKGDASSQQKPFWINCSASIIGYPYRIRFAYDGTKCCILIGDVSTVWNYPSLMVKDLQIGYTKNTLDGEWAIEYITSENGITDIIEPVVNGNMSVNYAKMFGPFTGTTHNQDSWGQLTHKNGYENQDLETVNGGAICFGDKGGETSMQIDGFLYQNEGNFKVVDEQSIKGLTAGHVLISDTRATNPKPLDYPQTALSMDFKSNSAIGLSGGVYSGVMTIFPWTDLSGGTVKQLAFGDSEIYFRTSDLNNNWCGWSEVINSDNIGRLGTMYVRNDTSSTITTGSLTLSNGNIDVPNGQISASKGFFESSDASIKTNVKDIDLSGAKNLHFVEFDRIDTKHHGYGVIAQEVEKLYPTVVTTDEHSGIKQVNYNEVYAIKLAYLENKIQELENRLTKAEKQKAIKRNKGWRSIFGKH